MSDRNAILRKLAALRKMTEGRGCTEAEARTAMEMADKLIQEYNLSINEQDLGTVGAVFREMPLDPPEVFMTLAAVGKFTDCRVWRNNASPPTIQMAGNPVDLDLAEWLLHTISSAMLAVGPLTMVSLALEGRGRNASLTNQLSAYRAGMAERISHRLKELKDAQTPITTPTGRDLVVVKRSIADDWLKAHGIRLGTGRAIAACHSGARSAGYAAGASVGLARPTGTTRPLAIGRK